MKFSPWVYKVFCFCFVFSKTASRAQQKTQSGLTGVSDPAAVIPVCVNPPGRAWPLRGCLCSCLPLCARSRQLYPCVEADSQIRRDARGCGAAETRGAVGRQSDDRRQMVPLQRAEESISPGSSAWHHGREASILPLLAGARANTWTLTETLPDDGRNSARGCWHAPLYPTDKHEHQAK